jgi:hypothetical protein
MTGFGAIHFCAASARKRNDQHGTTLGRDLKLGGGGLRDAESMTGHVCAKRTGLFAPGPPGHSPWEKFDAIAAHSWRAPLQDHHGAIAARSRRNV